MRGANTVSKETPLPGIVLPTNSFEEAFNFN
jgi:hypothetical protein